MRLKPGSGAMHMVRYVFRNGSQLISLTKSSRQIETMRAVLQFILQKGVLLPLAGLPAKGGLGAKPAFSMRRLQVATLPRRRAQAVTP